MQKKPWWVLVPLLLVTAAIIALRGQNSVDGKEPLPSNTKAQVLATFPHNPQDFCQGLIVRGNTVIEGTGRYGASVVKKYDLQTGQVSQQVALHPNYFGEGIALFENRIFQLTWKERVCVVYDQETLKPLGQLSYTGEGWGLTADDRYLYMSNGSSTIQVLDPKDLSVVRKIRVSYGRNQQSNLNELEFVGKELWACIWYEDRIARIDPETGKVHGFFDCGKLYPIPQRPDREHVLNGIAYDAQANRLFITGKLWPKIYEVSVPEDLIR